MKKLLMTMAIVLMTIGLTKAQSVVGNTVDLSKAVEAVKAKIAKSDAEIANAKKSSLMKTWVSRGKIMIEASQAPIKNITQGTPTNKETYPLYNIEVLVGAPSSTKTDGEYTVLVYPTCEVYSLNEVVQFCRVSSPADANALDKAVEAYRKAVELDAKGSLKSDKHTISDIQSIRNYYFNDGYAAYCVKDYEEAANCFAKAGSLTDFPLNEDDSTFNEGRTLFNAGLCYKEIGDFVNAEKYFRQSIDKNYDISGCYARIFDIMKSQGKAEEGINMLKSAYETYPNETPLLYSLIDAYSAQQKYNEAIQYLDKAIAKTPNMVILYTVKGNMYRGISQSDKDNYIKQLDAIVSKKKEAFRERNNAANLKRVEAELAQLQSDGNTMKTSFIDIQSKAEENYNLALKKDPKNLGALVGAAEIYSFDQSAVVEAEKNSILLSEDKDGKLNAAKDAELAAIYKKAAEYYETAYKENPSETLPLHNLKSLYYKLHDDANYARIVEELKKHN